MSEQKENEIKEKNNNNDPQKKKKKQADSSSNNLKRIRKDLMGFAKEEILNIKKSKKDINIANFEEKEIIAPSKYSLTAKHLKIDSFKHQSNKSNHSHFQNNNTNTINEEEDKKEETKDKDEISSSDISDDDEDDD